ncbi:hypothetical protein MJO28_004662 [Puccinia striiformis f. sp. tritici]|uniref:Uncharacterized protein n=1 Tax=Puccinia striiformis f. sp. tritici TaxID=168172 RepID=A0ACC0ET42_9BASI|nr:hypothetical protein MJO28_004662 [Puccinia striiformis f. sp. tritici]
MPLGPNTPATLIILAGSILLVLSTISNPIIKSFYFLSIKVASKVASIPLDGNIRLGTFGYCFELGSQLACTKPKLGYNLQTDSLGIPLPAQLDLTPLNPIISALTYALILHPIAAGLALISAIFGLVSHIREYSCSRYTSCFSSLASTAALLAFVLDIVAFSIAKKRLNALSDTNVAIDSQLGNAVWVTLAGWICLTLSGFFFCAGRCLFSRRHRAQAQADQLRPKPDKEYTKKMRTDADEAEKAREDAFTHKQSQSSLPAFAEYTNQHTNQEHIPLNRFNPNEQDLYSAQHHQVHSPDSFPSEHLDGVGMGYHQPPHHPLNTSQPSTDQGTAYHSLAASFLPPMPPQHTGTPTGDMYSHLPSHVSPALNTMNSPHQTPSSLTNRRLPPSLMPAGGLETRSSSYTSVPPSQLVGISGARPLHGPRTNSYASPGPSSQSHGARTSLPYPSYNRATAHPTQAHDPSLVDPLQYNQAGNTGQPPVNFPNPQPNHQTSTNPAVLGNYPHQNSHAYANPPSVMIQPGNHYTPQAFSDEPSQLSDLNAQPPVHHNTNLLNSSGPQFTNHNLFYSQATLHQDEHLNPSGSQSDNHSSFYSQATSNTTSNTVYSPQPYQLPNQLIGLAQGNIDEQDMYGGTAPTPSPEHPAPQNQLAHPPALPPLSFSPPPSHQSSSPPPAVTQPLHNHNHHPTPPSYS